MNVDAQDFLNLVEDAGELVFFDIESTGLKADYDSVLVISFKRFGQEPFSYPIIQVGNDQRIIREAKEILEDSMCWVSYYGKGFDIPFLNTRLMKWGHKPIQPRHHLDLYFTLKPKTSMSRKGLGSFARFLGVETQKIEVSQNVWSEIPFKKEHIKPMTERCEGDCITLEQLYVKTRHMVKEIKRG